MIFEIVCDIAVWNDWWDCVTDLFTEGVSRVRGTWQSWWPSIVPRGQVDHTDNSTCTPFRHKKNIRDDV